jgi:tRNA(Ile)-lysidine synthase
VLCTAHHADDQAETFLMRAARASGLSGLSAVRARVDTDVGTHMEDHGTHWCFFRSPITFIRPLLRWRRQELRAIAESMRLPFVDDPSNRDTRFDRARFRAWLAQAPWVDPVQIGRTAENLAALNADLSEISAWLLEQRRLPADGTDVRFDISELPRGVKRYLARRAIDSVLRENGMNGGGWTPASNIEPFLDALDAGNAATQANVMASTKGTVWHFRPAPPRRSH